MQKSNGSPRRKEAHFYTACSYEWSKNRLEQRRSPSSSSSPLNQISAPPLKILALFLLPKLTHLCMFQTYFWVCSVLKEGDENPQRQRHCLHFMFRTLVGEFVFFVFSVKFTHLAGSPWFFSVCSYIKKSVYHLFFFLFFFWEPVLLTEIILDWSNTKPPIHSTALDLYSCFS